MLEYETAKFLNPLLAIITVGDPSNFQGVQVNDIRKIEDYLQLNFSLCDFDFVDGDLIGEFARRSNRKKE